MYLLFFRCSFHRSFWKQRGTSGFQLSLWHQSHQFGNSLGQQVGNSLWQLVTADMFLQHILRWWHWQQLSALTAGWEDVATKQESGGRSGWAHPGGERGVDGSQRDHAICTSFTDQCISVICFPIFTNVNICWMLENYQHLSRQPLLCSISLRPVWGREQSIQRCKKIYKKSWWRPEIQNY